MSDLIPGTTERIIPASVKSEIEYLLYLRHLFAYEFVREMLPPESVVLDVGCGEGYGTAPISSAVKKAVGIDVDEKTIRYAQEKYRGTNCEFIAFDGKRIPFDDETFTSVVSFQVIEHVPDVQAYLKEIRRVVKKGGCIVLTTPNRTYRLWPGQKPWNRFHLREYDARGLKKVLEDVFGEVEVWGIRGTDEVQRKEYARVNKPSLLRYVLYRATKAIPEPVRAGIKNLFSGGEGKVRRGSVKANESTTPEQSSPDSARDFIEKYSISDYFVIKRDLNKSLDLLGICKR